MEHFVFGGNKPCFMASTNDDCRVIISVGNTKVKRNIMNSRANITVYQIGTVGGSADFTNILLKKMK